MHTQTKQTHQWSRRLSTGLCWFIAVECFFLAPFKFSPVGVLGWPSYFVKFVNWGYPAWFSPVIGASELVAAVLLILPRRRFLGAVMLVAILTGAVTTHIVNHDSLADSIAAPIMLVLAVIAALTHWPSGLEGAVEVRASGGVIGHCHPLGFLHRSPFFLVFRQRSDQSNSPALIGRLARGGRSSGKSRQARSKPGPVTSRYEEKEQSYKRT